MKRSFGLVAGTLVAIATSACGGKDASTLTNPPRSSSFPMYVTVPGTVAGAGGLYRISAPSSADGSSEPVALVTGLNFPAAVAVDRAGTVFYTERATPTTGRIMKYLGEGTEPEQIATGLYDPQGLVVDQTGRLYVAEYGANKVSLVNESDGTLEAIEADLAGPRSLSVDENDNLYVSEPVLGQVSKVIPDGSKQVIAKDLINPLGVGPGLVGNVFYLVGNNGLADGKAVKVDESGSASNYLEHLINPKSFDWEDSTILYVAEGSPAYRVVKYSRVSNIRTQMASLPGDPHTIVFTPD